MSNHDDSSTRSWDAAADDWRSRLERLTIALITLTTLMVVVSALLLTR